MLLILSSLYCTYFTYNIRMNISQAKELFITHLSHEKNASPRTIINYTLWIDRLIVHLQDKGVEQITRPDILSWRKQLATTCSQKTINYHLIAVRSLLKYLIKNDINVLDPNKIELSKIPAKEVSFLTAQEVTSILKAPLISPVTRARRDEAILYMLYWSWLRLSEMLWLKVKDIPVEWNQFQIVGKWGKLRSVFITKEAKKKVLDYIRSRSDDCEYVFTNRFCEPLWSVSVEKLVKKYAEIAWIEKKVTPHTLRHSFATSLLAKWADLRTIQILLWHASITTTQIYTHVSDPQLQKAHALLD